MKQSKIVIIIMVLSLFVTACNKKEKVSKDTPNTVNAETVSKSSEELGIIDYDFTELNYIMVAGQVFSMMYHPKDFVGKTFKIVGVYEYNFIENFEQEFTTIVVNDAEGCCPQGIPIELREGVTVPEFAQNIIVEGVYAEEKIGELSNYYIDVFSLEIATN